MELSIESNKVNKNTQKVLKEMENVGVYDQMLQQWVQQTVNSTGPTTNLVFTTPNTTMIRFPSAIPLNLMPLLLRSPEISKSDFDLLRQSIFTSELIDNCVSDYSTYLATFRGSLASSITTVEEAVKEINKRIEDIPGLGDRIRLFVLPEYRRYNPNSNNSALMVEKYSGNRFEPIFTVLPKAAVPKAPSVLEGSFGVLMLGVSLVSTFLYAVDLNSLNSLFMARAQQGDESVLETVLPIGYSMHVLFTMPSHILMHILIASNNYIQHNLILLIAYYIDLVFGVISLQSLHDSGHYAMAAVHNLRLSFPSYWLPSLQIGLFGSITNFLDYPKNRKQLFDVSIVGPLVGFLGSLAILCTGLSLTAASPSEVLSNLPQVPAGFFQISFLLEQIVDRFLHVSTLPPSALTSIHPLVAVGVVGLLSNALNFMPIGRLDGGRVAMSIAGRQSAGNISFLTLLAQAAGLVASPSNPISIFWIITVGLLTIYASLNVLICCVF